MLDNPAPAYYNPCRTGVLNVGLDDDVNGAQTVSEQSAFDAAKHITKVSGRDYLEVKWRLVWLRSEHPEAHIETELKEHARNTAVFRALVTLPNGASATGWGSESSDDFGDYLEKAETKALGRALAALGFGTQFCQDYDFGAEQQRVVDSPIDITRRDGYSSARPQQMGLQRQEATPKQIKYLHAVAREAGISTEDLDARSREQFGEELANLSRREISTLIEQIQSERTVA
jgi:predicted component of type VI protein secretion system